MLYDVYVHALLCSIFTILFPRPYPITRRRRGRLSDAFLYFLAKRMSNPFHSLQCCGNIIQMYVTIVTSFCRLRPILSRSEHGVHHCWHDTRVCLLHYPFFFFLLFFATTDGVPRVRWCGTSPPHTHICMCKRRSGSNGDGSSSP